MFKALCIASVLLLGTVCNANDASREINKYESGCLELFHPHTAKNNEPRRKLAAFRNAETGQFYFGFLNEENYIFGPVLAMCDAEDKPRYERWAMNTRVFQKKEASESFAKEINEKYRGKQSDADRLAYLISVIEQNHDELQELLLRQLKINEGTQNMRAPNKNGEIKECTYAIKNYNNVAPVFIKYDCAKALLNENDASATIGYYRKGYPSTLIMLYPGGRHTYFVEDLGTGPISDLMRAYFTRVYTEMSGDCSMQALADDGYTRAPDKREFCRRALQVFYPFDSPIQCYPNGKKAFGSIAMGVPHGFAVVYATDGTLFEAGKFVLGHPSEPMVRVAKGKLDFLGVKKCYVEVKCALETAIQNNADPDCLAAELLKHVRKYLQ